MADESMECGYCSKSVDHASDHTHQHLPLVCSECNKSFHLQCLTGQRPPSLLGDQLFKFSCSNCSLTGREEWSRPFLNWVHVIHLSLYNLIVIEDGRQGYFRWNTQICKFIEDHWANLMPHRQKTASWKCTVAGILSVNCPAIFKSGTQELGESGWWTLQKTAPPIFKDVMAALANDRSKKQLRVAVFEDNSAESASIDTSNKWSGKRYSSELNEDVLTDNTGATPMKLEPNEFFDYSYLSTKARPDQEMASKRPKVDSGNGSRRLTVSQEAMVLQQIDKHSGYYRVETCPEKARLYRKLKLRQRKRLLGLEVFDLEKYVTESIVPVKHYVTNDIHDDPVPVLESDQSDHTPLIDPSLNIKSIRKAETILSRLSLPRMPVLLVKGVYYHGGILSTIPTVKTFTSPYTSRLLKPIIFQSFDFIPNKVKLLTDIVRKKSSSISDLQYTPQPITLCYFREHHLSSVNALISYFFWPVNLKEYLQYPDFTVVIQYGKLVIGCGFMTPDVKVSEAYIPFLLVHPDFSGCGLGKVMLYHLIQSCQGKDITLHVSIDNPAMLLYQQFGFKAEEFCIDFYDKYHPPSYSMSKHAFLMRLRK